MPPIATTTGGPASAAAAPRKFELPVLASLDYSLTDGTDIPPPPDSPISEMAPPPPPPSKTQALPPAITTSVKTDDEQTTTRGRAPGSPTSGNGLLSPTSMTSPSPRRPSSIRRFLSRRSLNGVVIAEEGGAAAIGHAGRPESSLSMASTGGGGGAGQKRSRSWWRRFVGDGGEERDWKRTSVVIEERGTGRDEPAAPSLPEMSAFGVKAAGEEELDGDMFKNIR